MNRPRKSPLPRPSVCGPAKSSSSAARTCCSRTWLAVVGDGFIVGSISGNTIDIAHGPGRLAAEPGLHLHADFGVGAFDADQAGEKERIHAVEFDERECEGHLFQKLLGREIANRPGMNAAFGGHLEPLGWLAAIHTVDARSGVLVLARRTVAAQQFAFGQAMEERGVLLIA